MSLMLQNGIIPSQPRMGENTFTCTVFSDVHHGDRNYNDFTCTNALRKLRRILDETRESNLYINLGDFADYLKDGKITFYEEAAAVLAEYRLCTYFPDGRVPGAEERVILNVIGNHEAAYVKKSALAAHVLYAEGIGCVYTYRYGDMLFVSVDACFDRATGSDDPAVMVKTVTFTIPPQVQEAVEFAVAAQMDASVRGIVWLSHIAFKDIDDSSRMAVAEMLCRYGLPVTMLAGHTHVEMNQQLVDADDPSRVLVEIYTLPAVTSGNRYRYLQMTFASGRVHSVERRYDSTIELV